MQPAQVVTHEAVSASLRVVESAIALARAETKLALARTRDFVTQAVALLLGGLIAVTFLALTLAILSVSPLVVTASAGLKLAPSTAIPWPFALSLSAALAITGAGAWVALSALRRIKSAQLTEDDGGAP